MRRALLIVMLVAAGAAAEDPGTRPRLQVRAEAAGCPGVGGAFVALLDPGRGMLLLSGAPFPGGGEGPAVTGAPLEVGSWSIDELTADPAGGRLWSARYPFLGEKGSGCVAFDRHQFSAEGDLVSYLRWLVEKVYLQLPAAERESYRALTLSDRQVALRVEQEGYAPLRLAGREGSTLAFRVAGTESKCFLLPFILDQASDRVAVRSAVIAGDAFAPKEADWRAFVVGLPGETLTLPEVPARVVVEGISD